MFYKLVGEKGLKHTLLKSISGVLTVLATKKLGEHVFVPPESPPRSPMKSSAAAKRHLSPPAPTRTLRRFEVRCRPAILADAVTSASERRLLRVGLLTAITLTAHNFPEGMAVAISTMSSVNLGLKLAVAIALHNIPEGALRTPPISCDRLGDRMSAYHV